MHIPDTKWSEQTLEYLVGAFFLLMLAIQAALRLVDRSSVFSPWWLMIAGMTKNDLFTLVSSDLFVHPFTKQVSGIFADYTCWLGSQIQQKNSTVTASSRLWLDNKHGARARIYGTRDVSWNLCIASLIGSSIGEAQQACPEIGPWYNYALNNDLPKDDKLARHIIARKWPIWNEK